jgi:hypothetical protein
MSSYDRKRFLAVKNLGGKCACCGESCELILQIDHKNGDSQIDRRGKKSVYFIVSQLSEGRDLDRFQLLCANCHRIKTTLSMRYGHNLPLDKLIKARRDLIEKGAEFTRLTLPETQYKKTELERNLEIGLGLSSKETKLLLKLLRD